MKSYFAYIRVSTVKQGVQGCSLDEQKASIAAYAARHGLVIGEWFEERETAAKQGRSAFNRLTTLLKQGKAKGVIIHKIDRGARNLKDWAGLGDLIDMGIEVLFAHEGLDMQTRGGRLAADIQAVVAADFIRNLRQEVRKGFYGRLKQGYYPLPAPRGYENQGRAKAKTIHPVEGPLVAEAFRLYATGTHSLETLRHELARRGLRQANGLPLSFNGMSKLLRNPFYTGLIRIDKTSEVFEGNHAPLVTKAMFDRVQGVLSGRLYPRIETHCFRFRRLIKCQACGRSLTGERQKSHIYYRCHDRGCRGVSLSEIRVESTIMRELALLKIDGERLRELRDLFAEQVALERIRQGQAAQSIERDIGLIDGRLARLTDALIDGAIDKHTYDERRFDLLGRKRDLQDRLESGEDSTFWANVSQLFELGLSAKEDYILANDDQKRAAVQMFGSNLIAEVKTPYFPMRFPFDEIRNWVKTHDGEPYRGAVRTSSVTRMRIGGKRNVRSLIARIVTHQSHRCGRDGATCPQTSPQSP